MNRKTKLTLKQKVHVTDEIYNILREQKRKQGKSMAHLAGEAILKAYGDFTNL